MKSLSPCESAEASEISRRNVEAITKLQRGEEQKRSLSEAVADTFAKVVGSWTFIIVQSVILALWVMANVSGIVKAWDPYPFILLNLALSFQAAYASPIIMMSQNRQARLADQRNHLALQVALLAEQEDTETLRLLRKICERMQIPMEECEPALEQRTDPETLLRQIRDADIKE